MRCPSCKAENQPSATRCQACGKTLQLPRKKSGRRRGVNTASDTPFTLNVRGCNLFALRAYWVGVLALIPGLGLLLGPLAILLGLQARRYRADPEFTAHGPAWASLVLGVLITLTNWAGLILVGMGLGLFP